MNCPTQGLYAITQTERKPQDMIVAEVTAALRGGATLVQYRDKNPVDARSLAERLLTVCCRHDVPLIINDDIALAERIGAHGVHLGRNDGQIEEARRRLGPRAIIGVSCYNALELAVDAQSRGADYVAFGRFFPSSSKPLATPAAIETLQAAKRTLVVPIVAIGGILPENGRQLLTAGADLLAVIGGLFDHEPQQAAQAYRSLFDSI